MKYEISDITLLLANKIADIFRANDKYFVTGAEYLDSSACVF